jgi:HSP20 family protein
MPRRDIDRLQGEIEELFSDLWQVPRFLGLRHGFRPSVDCFLTRNPDELTVVAELAGIDPDSVEVAVDEQSLRISGQRQRPRVEGQVYQQMEIEYGPFERVLKLAEPVDVAKATASYDRGLLTVTLPIAARPAPQERVAIAINRSS